MPDPTIIHGRTLRALAALTDVETTRYALNCLHVGPDFVEACDGSILGRLTVPAAAFTEGLYTLPKCARIPLKPLTVTTNGALRLELASGEAVESPPGNGRFPKTDEILPKPEGQPTVTVNARVLRQALDVVLAAGTDQGRVELRIQDATTPILLTADTPDGQFAAIVMPLKPADD